ncbi:MAG: cold shock domain-containing protein [Candidatus Competibacter sp.]|nr:cold shock domain-containing protein [Candidatus Competibacter sp.]
MQGKIFDWKDDKGFGFIISENQSNKIFFHISDIENKQRRPKIGDFVDFDLTRDDQQRVKAKKITIKGLSSRKNILENQSNVEPVKKTILDYIAIIVLLLSTIAGGFTLYQTKDLNKIILYGIVIIVSLIFLSRQKKPKEKNFTCARCKTIAEFDKRTIQAWNKGVLKLYCSACHQQWLSTQPETEQRTQIRGSNNGCLGMFIALTLLPILTFIGVYSLLS